MFIDRTPLFIAAQQGNAEITNLLLKQKNININSISIILNIKLFF